MTGGTTSSRAVRLENYEAFAHLWRSHKSHPPPSPNSGTEREFYHTIQFAENERAVDTAIQTVRRGPDLADN